jgi:hypothetical protein
VPFGEYESGVDNLANDSKSALDEILVELDSAFFVSGSEFVEVDTVAPDPSATLPALFLEQVGSRRWPSPQSCFLGFPPA